jgi:hypothetical protein
MEGKPMTKTSTTKHYDGSGNKTEVSPLVERLKPIAVDMVRASLDAKILKKKAEKPGLKKRSGKAAS